MTCGFVSVGSPRRVTLSLSKSIATLECRPTCDYTIKGYKRVEAEFRAPRLFHHQGRLDAPQWPARGDAGRLPCAAWPRLRSTRATTDPVLHAALGGGRIHAARIQQLPRPRPEQSGPSGREWRIIVNRFVDTTFFYDAGKVTARRSDLDLSRLKSTSLWFAGGGLPHGTQRAALFEGSPRAARVVAIDLVAVQARVGDLVGRFADHLLIPGLRRFAGGGRRRQALQ